METTDISTHTEYFSKLYLLNELHRKDERFEVGKRVILNSKTNSYEGTITGFYNIDKASMGMKVDLLDDNEILFFRDAKGYYTSGTGDERHRLLIAQTEYGKTRPELEQYWKSESTPGELVFLAVGMDVNDLESEINATVTNEDKKTSLNRILSHPNFYHPFLHKDVIFVKFIDAHDETHFQVEFHCPDGVELIRVS
ncbi:MAG: hypothetical protein V4616_01680 [Bacteroidota bacterium]